MRLCCNVPVCEAGHHDPQPETGILEGEQRCAKCHMLLTKVDIEGYGWHLNHPGASAILIMGSAVLIGALLACGFPWNW